LVVLVELVAQEELAALVVLVVLVAQVDLGVAEAEAEAVGSLLVRV
jgi:hypothetical protein